MQLHVTEADGQVLIIAIDGGIDSSTATQFNERVSKLVDMGFDRIVLDASKLTYLSSLGVGTLMTLHTRMKRRGGDVLVAGLHGTAAEIFQLLRLDKLFRFYPDVDRAKLAFREPDAAGA